MSTVVRTLRNTFFSGLLVVLPILLSIAFIAWLFRIAESIFGGIPRLLLPVGWHFPGLGILCAVVVILLVGAFMHAGTFNRLVDRGERLLVRIPIIKTLYQGVRDLLGFFSSTGKSGDLKHAVLVELGESVHMIGVVTTECAEEDFPELRHSGEEDNIIAVYIQTSYQLGGYTIYLPASRVRRLDIPVEDALSVALTANMKRPRRVQRRTSG